MASSAITRGELLEGAYRISDTHGLAALSVRSLAQACNVSVGTIYNHFSSKDELTTAVIELYFRRSVMDELCRLDAGVGFVDYCENLYASLVTVLDRFRNRWLKDAGALPGAEKNAARIRERQILNHMLNGLIKVYKVDRAISPTQPKGFDAESVSRFALDNILSALHAGDDSCPVLFGLLRTTLYRAGD